MELTRIEKYKMMKTAEMKNIKEIIGETVRPVAELLTEYTAPDGKIHKVLAMRLDDGRMYRTECAAFVENYADYVACFGDDPDRPRVTITGKKSRTGNPYVNFVVVED